MTRLSLSAIRLDGGTQPRGALDPEHVARLTEALRAGADLPAVVVFYDGAEHWLADGFHRVAAHREAGVEDVAAEVRQGTRRDAVLYSVGANAAHGLPRSNADKRRAVETLLRDEEWGRWSDREIARRCAVHHDTVGRIRAEVGASGGFRQMDAPRIVERNGTVYEQRQRARVEEPAAEIPCDSGVLPALGKTPTPRAPRVPIPTVVTYQEIPDPDDEQPLEPMELEPEPVVRTPECDPSDLDGVPLDELASVTSFVAQASELREAIGRFVDAHPYESIRNPRMQSAYRSAFVHLVRVIVGRLPEPLRADLFDAPAAPMRPKLTIIQGGSR